MLRRVFTGTLWVVPVLEGQRVLGGAGGEESPKKKSGKEGLCRCLLPWHHWHQKKKMAYYRAHIPRVYRRDALKKSNLPCTCSQVFTLYLSFHPYLSLYHPRKKPGFKTAASRIW